MILTAFLVFYLTRLFYTVESYKTQLDYINFNLQNFPNAFAAWTWLGIEKRIYMKLPYGAMEAWSKGLSIRPNDFRLNWNMADVLAHLGFLDESIKYWELTKKGALPETTEAKWVGRIDEQIQRVKDLKQKAMENQEKAIIEQAQEIRNRPK